MLRVRPILARIDRAELRPPPPSRPGTARSIRPAANAALRRPRGNPLRHSQSAPPASTRNAAASNAPVPATVSASHTRGHQRPRPMAAPSASRLRSSRVATLIGSSPRWARLLPTARPRQSPGRFHRRRLPAGPARAAARAGAGGRAGPPDRDGPRGEGATKKNSRVIGTPSGAGSLTARASFSSSRATVPESRPRERRVRRWGRAKPPPIGAKVRPSAVARRWASSWRMAGVAPGNVPTTRSQGLQNSGRRDLPPDPARPQQGLDPPTGGEGGRLGRKKPHFRREAAGRRPMGHLGAVEQQPAAIRRVGQAFVAHPVFDHFFRDSEGLGDLDEVQIHGS